MSRIKPESACRALFLSILLALSAACSLAPGLYADNIPTVSGGKIPGTNIEFIPITADLVRQLRSEQESRLQRKRELAHQLYLDNERLKEDYQYRVGHTDVISVVSWGHPELNVLSATIQQGVIPQSTESIILTSVEPAIGTSHEVDLQGNIFYPYVGTTEIGSKTVPEIRALITNGLSEYIPDPQIDVSVSQYRSQRAYVVGEVQNPTMLQVDQIPLEILDALSQVGGLTEKADTRNATLMRGDHAYHIDLQAIIEGDLTQNYILQDGDVLVIPDNRFNSIFLLGEFQKNGQLVIPRSRFFSLADAITDTDIGGFTPDVDSSRLLVFRYDDRPSRDPGELVPIVYHLDMASAGAMLVAANFPMMGRDIVYAAPSGLVRWNRVVENVLPTIQAISLSTRAYSFADDLENSNR